MKCTICKHGQTAPGTTTVTLSRDGITIVFNSVPAQICDNCGEDYIDEATTAHLLKQAQTAVAAGVQVDVRKYAAA